MELVLKHCQTEQGCNHFTELTSSNQKLLSVIGRDINKSVANLLGLIALLDEEGIADPDFKAIHIYLAQESKKLHFIVREVCC